MWGLETQRFAQLVCESKHDNRWVEKQCAGFFQVQVESVKRVYIFILLPCTWESSDPSPVTLRLSSHIWDRLEDAVCLRVSVHDAKTPAGDKGTRNTDVKTHAVVSRQKRKCKNLIIKGEGWFWVSQSSIQTMARGLFAAHHPFFSGPWPKKNKNKKKGRKIS